MDARQSLDRSDIILPYFQLCKLPKLDMGNILDDGRPIVRIFISMSYIRSAFQPLTPSFFMQHEYSPTCSTLPKLNHLFPLPNITLLFFSIK